MLRTLMMLVLPWLGSADYQERDSAEAAMEALVWLADDPVVVKQGRESPDPEIACRCMRIFSRYQDLDTAIPMDIPLIDYEQVDVELWKRSWDNPVGLDGMTYAYLLLHEAEMDKRQVQQIVNKAIIRHTLRRNQGCFLNRCP